MPKPIKTIEHSLAKSIEHLSDLEAELKLLKSIDLDNMKGPPEANSWI